LALASPLWAEALYGHLPYAEAPAADLVNFESVQVHKEALPALKKMLNAARAEGINLTLVSGFRNMKRQHYLFYDIAKKRGQTPEERAKVSAPPGHSEHHTGMAFDFDDGETPVHLEESFAHTKAGRWLKKNASRFGFEMSFPPGNTQGVAYEPWHWRMKVLSPPT
jgi:D-alanyl-D-alanine carboxypeptidase